MSGPVNLPGWVLSIPASLALHAVPAMLLLRLFTPSVHDVFVVDLTESPETVQVQPKAIEPAKRPSGPPTTARKAAPSPPRSEASATSSVRAEAPAEHPAVSPPASLAAVAPEPTPRVPEPPAQPPAATPISPVPPTPAAVAEPTPPAADPPRQAASAVEAVFATSTAANVERDAVVPVVPPASASAPSPPPAATARVSPGTSDARQVNAGTRASAPGGGGEGHEAEYRAYLGLVRQRILEALRYPLAARQQGLVGTVYIEIVVQPSGAISDVKIISPSSHPILDQAALETVRSLPSIGFPPGLVPRQLRARLPVVFNLR